MDPVSLILKRAEHLKNKEFGKIYDMYDDKSIMKNFYPSKDDYIIFMKKFSKSVILKKMEILDCDTKGSFAKVVSKEFIQDFEENSIIVNKCTTYLKNFSNRWTIIKENRIQIEKQ
ncbi:hypothetical protein DEFDS_1592 [Deferribacter desulfuricans SSM1]|uniref:SnoaL-like domain-containing protein n=1 Tax=Deferribacter desulfuricans (strain DSM 14783 / JCM 11476 / NBRC 101012 / SSM1) TaxID=639282 RepID=D3P8L0_DEFDS|nr:hypothetical protein [Deferribacter desulfuricans]BAI81050.1 hypothetical protein DEFDS_1592 [Deferribacter desulfuricans SSM1]